MGASLKLQAQASAQRISAAPFPFPITRTSSCIVQYMAMRTNRMIWIAQKCGQMQRDEKKFVGRSN